MASARVGIDLGRAAIVWLFNGGSGSQRGHQPARLLLRLHVLMQHATAVQFILMSEMENSRAALNPTEGLALARRKFVIICDIHGGKWSTGDTDAPWSDPALPLFPSHIGVVTDVMGIYTQTRVDDNYGPLTRPAHGSGSMYGDTNYWALWRWLISISFTSWKLSNGRPSWNSFESGQVWKMVTSSHHLHIMKAKLNGQTQLHAMISKICCCGFSLLEYIFIFVISEVWVKTKMSQFPSLKWRKSELLPSTANEVDIWQYCVFHSSTLCWCLFVAAVSTFICFFYICKSEIKETFARINLLQIWIFLILFSLPSKYQIVTNPFFTCHQL